MAKPAAARKAKAPAKVSKARTAKTTKMAAARVTKVAKTPMPAKPVAAGNANGQMPANQTVPAPASTL